MSDLIRYLGTLGSDLPDLSEENWDKIFNFIEIFLVTENKEDYNFNLEKMKDVLILLKKVK